LAELVETYLSRHAAVVRSRTIVILRERLAYATRDYGDVPLSELLIARAGKGRGGRGQARPHMFLAGDVADVPATRH
jgi:hypothetical protein